MTTSLDLSLPATVAGILSRLGKTVTFTVVETVEDEDADMHEFPTLYVSKRVAPPSAYKVGLVDGDLVKDGDMWSLVGAADLGFTPDIKAVTRVGIDGEDWTVLRWEPIYSGDNVVAYKFQMRKKV